MPRRNLPRALSFLALMSLSLVVALTPAEAQGAGKDKDLLRLQKQRLEAAEQLVDSLEAARKAGQAEVSEEIRARQLLLAMRMELADGVKGMVKLAREHLGAMKALEEAMAVALEAGHGRKSDLLKARVARLSAEIRVHQLELALAPARKRG